MTCSKSQNFSSNPVFTCTENQVVLNCVQLWKCKKNPSKSSEKGSIHPSADRQTFRLDRQTFRQTDRQTDRLDRQTDMVQEFQGWFWAAHQENQQNDKRVKTLIVQHVCQGVELSPEPPSGFCGIGPSPGSLRPLTPVVEPAGLVLWAKLMFTPRSPRWRRGINKRSLNARAEPSLFCLRNLRCEMNDIFPLLFLHTASVWTSFSLDWQQGRLSPQWIAILSWLIVPRKKVLLVWKLIIYINHKNSPYKLHEDLFGEQGVNTNKSR